MRRPVLLVLLIAAFILGSPTWSRECQYAFVVDPCEKRVVILPVGGIDEAYQVRLDEGPAADHEPRGVALASVPGWDAFHAFVTQGHYLHIIDYELSNSDATIDDVRTIDLAGDLSLPPLELAGLYAADPVEINGENRYFLYLVGTEPGPYEWPWFVVFEQQELLTGTGPYHGLWYAERISTDPGRAVDIAGGAAQDGDHFQEAFASVVSFGDYGFVQRFYRITVEDGVGFGAWLDPWNDEGTTFSGGEPDSLGLDYDSLGLEAHGVFQTSSVVSDLHTGESSCDLVGDPTDVAIWGPDSWGGYVHFVTVSNGAGAGTLLGYDEGVCPYSDYGPPELAPDALGITVHSRPLSLDLSSDTSDSTWVYTANASGDVTAVQLSVVADESGATLTIADQFHVDTEGCPSAVVFRDPAHAECVTGKLGDPRPTPDCPSPKYCVVYPTDPQCLFNLCAKPKIN